MNLRAGLSMTRKRELEAEKNEKNGSHKEKKTNRIRTRRKEQAHILNFQPVIILKRQDNWAKASKPMKMGEMIQL